MVLLLLEHGALTLQDLWLLHWRRLLLEGTLALLRLWLLLLEGTLALSGLWLLLLEDALPLQDLWLLYLWLLESTLARSLVLLSSRVYTAIPRVSGWLAMTRPAACTLWPLTFPSKR